MRADKIKKWLDYPGRLPSHKGLNNQELLEEYPDLTSEDWMIIGLIEKAQSDGNAAAFNGLMDHRYGKQATGNGEELSGGSDITYSVSFRGVQTEIE